MPYKTQIEMQHEVDDLLNQIKILNETFATETTELRSAVHVLMEALSIVRMRLYEGRIAEIGEIIRTAENKVGCILLGSSTGRIPPCS
jgi:cell division septum initiation protein DivIVA